jgi:hypothetical protein
MVFVGILFALFWAIVLTVIFAAIFRNTGPWNGFWIFFILIFLIALGVGEWAAPVGPSAWGYYWIPGLLAAIVLALILAAVVPSTPSNLRNTRNVVDEETITEPANTPDLTEPTDTENTTLAFGIFFWIVIIVLVIIAIAGIVETS